MDFIELAAKRRSVRKFTGRQVEKDIVDTLIRTTLTAPSSKNVRSTRLAVVTDKKILEDIGRMRSTGSSFVKDAPMAFIIMGDETSTDLWEVNSSISATMLQFAAESLGLGSCWVQVSRRPHRLEDPDGITVEEYLHELIPATKPYRILCVVALGYPESEPNPHTFKDDSDKVIFI